MGSRRPSILVVGGADASRIGELLGNRGARAETAESLEAALGRLDRAYFEAVFLDATLEGASAVARLLGERPDAAVVAFGAAADAAEALRAGAVEYVSSPPESDAVARALDAALAREQAASGVPSVSAGTSAELLGTSPHMLAVREVIARIAPGTSTVLVRGETGTGKELVARALHAGSPRHTKPFVKVHAAALPEDLLESELFGYEKGAFTGAVARKPGRVELAEGGTLFLDEIGEISLKTQAKLLRLVQDREYERLGGSRTLKANVRFVTATHRDLKHMVEQGTFREDLLYRLDVVTVWLPPLRARREDIALIANHYLGQFRGANQKPAIRLEESALEHLKAQRWTGNVRELVNFVERMVVLSKTDVITLEDVRRELDEHQSFTTQSVPQDLALIRQLSPAATSAAALPVSSGPAPRLEETAPSRMASPPADTGAVRFLSEEVREAEHRALVKALSHAAGNRTQAARMLGISRRTLYTKLEEHGLD